MGTSFLGTHPGQRAVVISSPEGNIVKIKISKTEDGFVADPVSEPGSPPVGRGGTITEALGDFLIHYQAQLGLIIDIDSSALDAENARRLAAFAQR